MSRKAGRAAENAASRHQCWHFPLSFVRSLPSYYSSCPRSRYKYMQVLNSVPGSSPRFCHGLVGVTRPFWGNDITVYVYLYVYMHIYTYRYIYIHRSHACTYVHTHIWRVPKKYAMGHMSETQTASLISS